MELISANLDILLFLTACILLMAGFPVAFTLAGTGLAFAALGTALGTFDVSLASLPSRIFGTMTNQVLIAVPLFVFMGVMLEKSRVAEDLLDTMGKLFGPLRGGLGLSVVAVGALLAASTGIVGATVVTMGLLSLPTMLRRGYDPALASGVISASGTLGQIIPPSIVLILLGDQLSTAHQEAQQTLQNQAFTEGRFDFVPAAPFSVADLFAGALIPGLVLVAVMLAYIATTAWLKPNSAPAVPADERFESAGQMWSHLIWVLIPPVVLIVAVLGSIFSGLATATEGAAVGAAGAILLAGLRLGAGGGRAPLALRWIPEVRGPVPVAAAALALVAVLLLTHSVDLRVTRNVIPGEDRIAIWVAAALCLVVLWGLAVNLRRAAADGCLTVVVRDTSKITSMVFTILIGATMFSLAFRGLGGDETVQNILTSVPGDVYGALLVVMAVMFVLGFFLDFIEITFVVVPLVAPALFLMGIDPVWLGVLMAMNLQTSFLTPPFGFALFYLRGVAPDSVKTSAIYRGALPFVCLQIIVLALIFLIPAIATWLPGVLLE
jgi:TRAP-type mannitol/chloroaromatic compound transport system permease large subunit